MITFSTLVVAVVAALAGAEPPVEPNATPPADPATHPPLSQPDETQPVDPQQVDPLPVDPIATGLVPFSATAGEVYEIAGGKGRVQMMLSSPNYMGIIEGFPGLVVPEHEHATETEMLYVLEGGGWMVVGGKRQAVTAGMAIQVPPGVKHSFMIPPDAAQGFRAVQVYTPAGPEQRFKQGKKVDGGQ